jgi:hypothetical protein
MPPWDTFPINALSAGEAISAADSEGVNGNAQRATKEHRTKILGFMKVLLEQSWKIAKSTGHQSAR